MGETTTMLTKSLLLNMPEDLFYSLDQEAKQRKRPRSKIIFEKLRQATGVTHHHTPNQKHQTDNQPLDFYSSSGTGIL